MPNRDTEVVQDTGQEPGGATTTTTGQPPVTTGPTGQPQVSPQDLERVLMDINRKNQYDRPGGMGAVLPPHYYYPNLAQQDVLIGQSSSPYGGSRPIFSPGMPLIPFSVLDAIDAEKAEQKKAEKKVLDELEKGFGEFEIS